MQWGRQSECSGLDLFVHVLKAEVLEEARHVWFEATKSHVKMP